MTETLVTPVDTIQQNEAKVDAQTADFVAEREFSLRWLFLPCNRDTLRILVEYSLMMLFLPLVTFKLSRKFSAAYLSITWQHYLPAILSILAVKVVTTLFLVKAFSEDDDDEPSPKQKAA